MARNATPRFITSITTDVFSADIASEACPTDAITHGHGFEIVTFNASNLVYRKEQMLAPKPAHMGANAVFNQAEVAGGAPQLPVPGASFSVLVGKMQDAGPSTEDRRLYIGRVVGRRRRSRGRK